LQEFAIEIPDAEADEIRTVQQGKLFSALGICPRLQPFTAIDYIAKTPEGTPVTLKLPALAHASVFQLTNRRYLIGFVLNAVDSASKMLVYYPYLISLDPIQSALQQIP